MNTGDFFKRKAPLFNLTQLVLTLGILLSNTQTIQAGGYSGGGADVIILPNDSVVLNKANTPALNVAIKASEFSTQLKEELNRLGHLLARYGAKVSITKPDIADFFVQNILNDELVEYFFVKTVSADCQYAQDINSAGTKMAHIGCTQGAATYIVKDLFDRLTVRDQARLIFHERLHSLGREVPHYIIFDLTDGADLLLSLYDAQLNGRRPILTSEQVQLLEKFRKRVIQARLYEQSDEHPEVKLRSYVIEKNGGGLKHVDALLGLNYYIGVGGIASKKTYLLEGSELIDTSCILNRYALDPVLRAQVEDDIPIECALFPNSKLNFTTLNNVQQLYLAEGSTILRSQINLGIIAQKEILKFYAPLDTADIGKPLESKNWIKNWVDRSDTYLAGVLALKKGASLFEVEINGLESVYLDENAKIVRLTFEREYRVFNEWYSKFQMGLSGKFTPDEPSLGLRLILEKSVRLTGQYGANGVLRGTPYPIFAFKRIANTPEQPTKQVVDLEISQSLSQIFTQDFCPGSSGYDKNYLWIAKPMRPNTVAQLKGLCRYTDYQREVYNESNASSEVQHQILPIFPEKSK